MVDPLNFSLKPCGKDRMVLLETSSPALSRSNIVKNNQIKLIGRLDALQYIDHILMTVCRKRQRLECLVDLEDYTYLRDYIWCVNRDGYAVTDIDGDTIYMHRFVIQQRGLNNERREVDHINRNRIDNRFMNLRICEKAENTRNLTKRERTSSIYKGVSYNNEKKKFRTELTLNGKVVFRKNFMREIDAAKAYNEAALKYHGEFASLNPIPSDVDTTNPA